MRARRRSSRRRTNQELRKELFAIADEIGAMVARMRKRHARGSACVAAARDGHGVDEGRKAPDQSIDRAA
jgi:hypothetical protein